MDQFNSAIMRQVAFPVGVAGVLVTVVSAVMAGSSVALGALLGTAVVLVFFAAGQLVLGTVLRTNPMMGMTAAMMLYVVKIGVLLALLVVLGDATFMNTKAFAMTILACTVVWTVLEVLAFSRLKTLYVDPDNPAPGFPAGQAAGRRLDAAGQSDRV